jgi:hypothetical protein
MGGTATEYTSYPLPAERRLLCAATVGTDPLSVEGTTRLFLYQTVYDRAVGGLRSAKTKGYGGCYLPRVDASYLWLPGGIVKPGKELQGRYSGWVLTLWVDPLGLDQSGPANLAGLLL